jgi:hypothetical protein
VKADANSPWKTAAESAAIARCGVKLIYRAVKRGELKAARISARADLRIHTDWISTWLENAATPKPIETSRSLRRVRP